MEEALRRGWENLIGRADGPMNFRLIMQPAVALVLAIRAGLKDARAGQPPFLWTIFSNPAHRHELLRHGWKDVGTVFIVALILDSIYQVIVHAGIYTLELLITATLLAIVPYCLARGLITRIARRGGPASKPAETVAAGPNRESTEEAGADPESGRDVEGDGLRTDRPRTKNPDV